MAQTLVRLEIRTAGRAVRLCIFYVKPESGFSGCLPKLDAMPADRDRTDGRTDESAEDERTDQPANRAGEQSTDGTDEPVVKEPAAVDRQSPVGAPVIRGDVDLLGERAANAVAFDPDDPESRARAAEIVAEFAAETRTTDPLFVLRGAAACAALVRGEGSYKAAAERAGGDVPVTFIRKWARVHDLPYAVRRYVAVGELAPSAAKHIARVDGDARFVLAWAALDNDLTVRQIRSIASDVNNGTSVNDALAAAGIDPGQVDLSLPVETYVELRRRAALTGTDVNDVVDAALAAYFEQTDPPAAADRRGPYER